MKITVLGCGAWGTALACAYSSNTSSGALPSALYRHHVTLWGRDNAHINELTANRVNLRYLPRVPLPPTLKLSANLGAAIQEADVILSVTPTSAFAETLHTISKACRTTQLPPIVWACKGFDTTDPNNPKMPHEIVQQVLGDRVKSAALSGPSFAIEVANGQPTALCCASTDEPFATMMARELSTNTLRVYSSTDLIGVELGGALKNVIALAAGISDGLGLGLNARAALITRGVAEMARLGAAMGGKPATFMGLTGLGDLVLTATGELSRNRTVGMRLAKGEALVNVLASLGHVSEGVRSAGAALMLANKHGVEMPITEQVNRVLNGTITAADAVRLLLMRDVKSE
jgi:glycerol-3-phosphate dehydrogenase (NAD(P)+)